VRNKLAIAAIGAALLIAPRLAAAQTAAPDARIFAGGLVGVTFGTETGAMFGGRIGFRVSRNLHLFAEVGRITDVTFFVPGGGGPATVNGFASVFSDVDQPNGSGPGKKRGNRGDSTLMEFFGADGSLLFSSFVPASPGNGGLSFFAIKFNDARIASVRITAGNVAPGPDDDAKNDVVMMDDFIYGEPQVSN